MSADPNSAARGDGTSKPPRRRPRPPSRSSADSPAAKSSQMFYFVDSNSSSREKRAHVMRHHVSEKRKQRKHSDPPSDPEHRPYHRPLRYRPWQHTPGSDVESLQDSDTSHPQVAAFPPTGSSSPAPHPVDTLPHFSPVTPLDASRKDPFDSLPITMPAEDLELADYWTNKLTYWSGQNRHIKGQIFQVAMSHPLSFQAVILSYCARWKLQLYGLASSKEATDHLHQVTHSVSKDSSKTLGIDHLAMVLTGLALQEERFGNRPDAMAYADRAVHLVRSRPGTNSFVEVFLHYVRYLLTPLQPSIGPDGQQWLVTFLRGAEELMLEHSTESYLSTVPQRRDAFTMESPLFTLLSSGPHPSQVPQDARMFVVRDAPTQEVTRTAALIYITAALWDFQDHAGKTGRFLQHLQTTAKAHGLDRNPACETFVWLLLEERYESDLKDPERGWSTGELLHMHKQLRADLQFHFSEILFSFLTLTPPIRGIEAFEQELGALAPEGNGDGDGEGGA